MPVLYGFLKLARNVLRGRYCFFLRDQKDFDVTAQTWRHITTIAAATLLFIAFAIVVGATHGGSLLGRFAAV
jgi:hypothetical protein